MAQRSREVLQKLAELIVESNSGNPNAAILSSWNHQWAQEDKTNQTRTYLLDRICKILSAK